MKGWLVSKRQCPDLQKNITILIELDDSLSEADSGVASVFASPKIPSERVTPHQTFQNEIVEFDRSKLKHREKNVKKPSENFFDKFKNEIRDFDKSKLKKIETQKSNFDTNLSPWERMHAELTNFNRKKLRHVETKFSSPPVFDKNNKFIPEDLYVLIPVDNFKDAECQTDPITIKLEQDSGIQSDEEEYEWGLVEEKVTLIRIEESTYYVDESDEDWDAYEC